jgi:hypothetical protein
MIPPRTRPKPPDRNTGMRTIEVLYCPLSLRVNVSEELDNETAAQLAMDIASGAEFDKWEKLDKDLIVRW